MILFLFSLAVILGVVGSVLYFLDVKNKETVEGFGSIYAFFMFTLLAGVDLENILVSPSSSLIEEVAGYLTFLSPLCVFFGLLYLGHKNTNETYIKYFKSNFLYNSKEENTLVITSIIIIFVFMLLALKYPDVAKNPYLQYLLAFITIGIDFSSYKALKKEIKDYEAKQSRKPWACFSIALGIILYLENDLLSVEGILIGENFLFGLAMIYLITKIRKKISLKKPAQGVWFFSLQYFVFSYYKNI